MRSYIGIGWLVSIFSSVLLARDVLAFDKFAEKFGYFTHKHSGHMYPLRWVLRMGSIGSNNPCERKKRRCIPCTHLLYGQPVQLLFIGYEDLILVNRENKAHFMNRQFFVAVENILSLPRKK